MDGTNNSELETGAPDEAPAGGQTPARVVILTGLSGSGKSTAIRALEDAGFFCIDNLPVPLLPKVLELAGTATARPAMHNFAFVVDTRERLFLDQASAMVEQMKAEGVNVRVIFLEADDNTLVRRYSETRRRHPLSDGGTLRDGIATERQRLQNLRERADVILDTSQHTVHTLKALIQQQFAENTNVALTITVLSFGFKYGIPAECDLVFDLRFLPNPYFVEGLREKTGQVQEVRNYVLGFPEAGRFISLFQDMAEFMLPMYEREGKSYLTIGMGCTGGRHRSVSIGEAIVSRLRGRRWSVSVRHRDIERP